MAIIVGKVYANWCGHCQILKPEWKALKKLIPKGRVQFKEFEESEIGKRSDFEKKMNIKLDVNGYPTIFKIHSNKQVEYYLGPRTAYDMRRWVLSSSSKKTVKRGFPQKRTRKVRSLFFL